MLFDPGVLYRRPTETVELSYAESNDEWLRFCYQARVADLTERCGSGPWTWQNNASEMQKSEILKQACRCASSKLVANHLIISTEADLASECGADAANVVIEAATVAAWSWSSLDIALQPVALAHAGLLADILH